MVALSAMMRTEFSRRYSRPPKKNALLRAIGPPAVPLTRAESNGGLDRANAFFELSRSSRPKYDSCPWRSFVPERVTTLTTAVPARAYSASNWFRRTRNSCTASWFTDTIANP